MMRDGIVETNSPCEHSSGLDVALGQVDAGHAAAVLDRQRPRGASNPATDVEDPRPRAKTGKSCEFACGGASANVEVLERREVVRG